MPVFTRRINEKIDRAARSKRVQSLVTSKADQAVETAKRLLADDIDNDPSSRKIDSDPETIGFFGFEPDDQPIEDLKYVIDERIDLNRRPKKENSGKGVAYKYSIKYPSEGEIYSEGSLNLPWISQTWVEKLQRGIGNMEQFLFFPAKGRSEFGIQGKPAKSGSSLNSKVETPDPDYLNRIRKNFSEDLTKAGLKTKR